MSKASPLSIRLFLEGYEVPVISAQVTSSPNKAAVASIQVLPSGMGLHLLPRTLVHLFFLDDGSLVQRGTLKPGEALAEAAAKIDAAEEGSSTLNRIAADDKDYKLMFCGEIVGFNYSKTPTGRQLVLQCMDLSSYWDACYQWFADYSPGGTALTDKAHMFVGAGEGLFDNVASGTKWVIGRLLTTRPRTPEYQKAKGLAGGIIHLMEAVGGLRYRDGVGYHGVNDFFTIAELRYNLLGQLGALESDTTSSKLYNSKAFFDWLRNGMTSLGNLISFRDIINHVNKYIFHEVYPNTCPRYLSGAEAENARKQKKVDSSTLEDDEVFGSPALQAMRDTRNILNLAVLKFKSARTGLGGVAATSSSRLGPFTEGVSALKAAKKKRDSAEDWVGRSASSDASSVKSELVNVGSKIDEAIKATSGKTSDLVNLSNKALGLVEEAEAALASLTNLEHRTKNKAPRNTTATTQGDRLFTQLFLPDCFFASPPRCNVIFPDEYFSFNFSRNFLREVTRLSCQGGLGVIGAGSRRGASILGRHYFAPNVRDAAGRNLRVTLQYGGRVLLRHETHSGIIPKFSWITQGHRWGVKAANKTGAVKIGNKISYVQRLANFQFFLHRWASRSLSLSCVFKPSLALGFPSLVIDKPLILSEAVQKAYGEALGTAYVPPQFLGKLVQLDHNITQSGGQTTAILSHCRLHQGLDDELLGMLYEEKLNTKAIKKVDVDYQKMAEDPTYKRGERTELSRLLRRYLDGQITEDRPLRNQGVIKTVKAGPEVRLSGNQVFNLGLPSRQTEGARVTVPKTLYVEIAQERGTGQFIRKEGATIEDSLRPGWFSDDIWGRDNIGTKVYQFLLGCNSITDDVPVTSQELQERFKKLRSMGATENQAIDATWDAAQTSGAADDALEAAGISLAGVVEGSIEEAINAIASIYGEIRTNKHYSVHDFIRNFTYRPIATLEDVLGSADLEFGDDGNPKEDTMVEGFHSRAFGDYNTEVRRPTKEGYETEVGDDALFLLFPGKSREEVAKISMGSMLDRSEPTWSLRPDFDPRGRALARVRAYAAEMQITRGLIG